MCDNCVNIGAFKTPTPTSNPNRDLQILLKYFWAMSSTNPPTNPSTLIASEDYIRNTIIPKLVVAELLRAYNKHGKAQWSRHEFYGVLKEEIDEIWDSIKSDDTHEELIKEIIQVMCICLRYLETGDRYTFIEESKKNKNQ